MIDDKTIYRKALDDFNRERKKAALSHFWAGITGKSLELLPFDEISSKLHATSKTEKGLHTVPLDLIVGSVGRYTDFDRNFAPLLEDDQDRWARVKTAMTSAIGSGVPPVSLYKVGEAYFVLDGNHRVSVAKQMGMKDIEAYVTEIKTKVPISHEISPRELILKEEYVKFLEETKIDHILPSIDFSLNTPGLYPLLKEHIDVHRFYMGVEEKKDIGYEEAVRHWFYEVYLPVVDIINESGLTEVFKEKTETDLYLWVLDHQTQLQHELGWEVKTNKAVEDLARSEGKEMPESHTTGMSLFDINSSIDSLSGVFDINPDDIEISNGCLFEDILVAINGLDSGWDALEQAIRINRCKDGRVRGLHIAEEGDEKLESIKVLRTKFEQTLADSGMAGNLVIANGEISKVLSSRALLNDLLVLKLLYPPAETLFDRWSSGFSSILRNSKRPILVVQDQVTDLSKILLAYDGSTKSKEALFISVYFVSKYGGFLDIITINDSSLSYEKIVTQAKEYLEKMNISYHYYERSGEVVEGIQELLKTTCSNLLIVGGYGHSTLMGVIFGSSIDSIIKNVTIPILICQ